MRNIFLEAALDVTASTFSNTATRLFSHVTVNVAFNENTPPDVGVYELLLPYASKIFGGIHLG